MSTVTSPDGTVIDYDRYGDGPAVIFIGGASAYRAIDEGTTQTARRLAAEGYTAVDYDRRGRGKSGDTQPWALDREVEDVAELIKAAGGAAALCANSSGADIALAAATARAGVTALVLYEPPFSPAELRRAPGRLRSLLADSKNDEAMRYNLTSVIGLPADAVNEMAQAPWWAAMAAVAPTWSTTTPPRTRSTSTPTGANAGPRSPCRRSCAQATRPSPACPRPPTRWPPRCRTQAAAPCQVKATGRHPRRWCRCCWTSSSPDQAALTSSRGRCQTRCPNVKRRAKPQWHRTQMDLTSYGHARTWTGI